MNSAVLLRKLGGRLVACLRDGYGLAPVASSRSAPSLLAVAGVLCAVLVLPVLGLAALAFTLGAFGPASTGALLAIAFAAPKDLPGEMKKKYDDLQKILGELAAGQKEMSEGKVDQKRGEELDAKALEAETLQKEIDRYARVSGITSRSREVDNPKLPGGGDDGEAKGAESVAGYLTLGELAAANPQYLAFVKAGAPVGMGVNVRVPDITMLGKGGIARGGLVPVTRGQIEAKAVVVGAGVLRPSRDPDPVRLPAEMDRLMVRDLFNQSRTDGTSVQYIAWTLTRGAAPVAEGAAKPEATVTASEATTPVRTIAVHTPVTEQQLQDVPDVQNIIDVELTWDLKKTEEQQLLWGAGTGATVLGLYNTPGVAAMSRVIGGDTLIDKARRCMTDVVVAGGEPNMVVVDPLDWESMVLSKATDNSYIWVVVTDAQGNPRLWGARVVETVAAREPGVYATNERRLLVGDGRRGATIWDRQDVDVQIGFVGNQFIENKRTIRIEERLAFGVKRPHFFRYVITQARVTS